VASVFKREVDRRRGAVGKWTGSYRGPDGRWRSFAGSTDKAATQAEANRREAEARLVREGIVAPKESTRRKESARPIAEHVEDFRLSLIAKGRTAKHADHQASTLARLLSAAGIGTVAELGVEPVVKAVAGLTVEPKGRSRAVARPASARTKNHARASFRAFARWLWDSDRMREPLRGLGLLGRFNEEADRRRVRRALSPAEFERLVEAAEKGPPITLSRRGYQYEPREITGAERAILYRLAAATGFRAKELRTLTIERFDRSPDNPTVRVLAAYAKNGREVDQPIARKLAADLSAWLESRAPGKPVLDVPEKTAKLLRHDLKAAGIPYVDDRGRVIDFHALRVTFITSRARNGVHPAKAQKLARHSDVKLTLGVYTRFADAEIREALEGDGTAPHN